MTLDRRSDGSAVLTLEAREIALLRWSLERATFTDTPAERQQEIFRFADDLLRALSG